VRRRKKNPSGSTWLLLGAAAVVGYLVYKHQTAAPALPATHPYSDLFTKWSLAYVVADPTTPGRFTLTQAPYAGAAPPANGMLFPLWYALKASTQTPVYYYYANNTDAAGNAAAVLYTAPATPIAGAQLVTQ
jgi:hypothetical protein